MKIKIIGSGGCTSLPKPLCQCEICKEAREKGKPYSRFGCALYIEDLKLLIDTPEDICYSLNHFDVREIENVFYSHMDPDHTLGMRVFEQMKLNWLEVSEGKECTSPINVFAMKHVMEDLNCICSKYGSYFDYYENIRKLIKRNIVDNYIYLNDVKITFVKAGIATVFVFENSKSKVIYAPCDVKPFPKNDIFKGADIMIIGNTIVDTVLKDGYVLKKDNILSKELFTMNEIEKLKSDYKIKKVVITHLEEDWGKSYDDYLKMQNKYEDIIFAYDGITFDL